LLQKRSNNLPWLEKSEIRKIKIALKLQGLTRLSISSNSAFARTPRLALLLRI
jgi:hypothetical protein